MKISGQILTGKRGRVNTGANFQFISTRSFLECFRTCILGGLWNHVRGMSVGNKVGTADPLQKIE